MLRLRKVLLILLYVSFNVCACSAPSQTPPPPVTPTIVPTATSTLPPVMSETSYVVDGTLGDDGNPGGLDQPWRTIQKALETVTGGSTIYVRGGVYPTVTGGWRFQNSGTQFQPITLTNYPGEQVVFKNDDTSSGNNYPTFMCLVDGNSPAGWQTPDAQYIRIIGTDVPAHTLSDGVVSTKGLVFQGIKGNQDAAIRTNGGCSNWEIAGVDFVETGDAIFTFQGTQDTDGWVVHDNRVYNFYRESGMQFNGNNNTISNNLIEKVSGELDTPYGCQMLNLLGHGNEVRGNTISRMGSQSSCYGVMFEWDYSDNNVIENNTFMDVPVAVVFEGGDGNIIRNNVMTASPGTKSAAISIQSYDNQTSWPCDDVPNPQAEDLPFLSNPHNCHSQNNQIYGNRISGFPAMVSMTPVADTSNTVHDNTFIP